LEGGDVMISHHTYSMYYLISLYDVLRLLSS